MTKVSLFTHNFLDGYNQDYSRVYGGGLERYIYDLCLLIQELGHQPVVHQLSYGEPFLARLDGIDVFGHVFEQTRIVDAFDRMAEMAEGVFIYTSCIWHPLRYRPGSLGICHGINWDRPSITYESKRDVAQALQGAMEGLRKLVSVDSHVVTYCRSVCMFGNPEQIELIPNAVDTRHFSPRRQQLTGTDVGEGELRILYPRRLSLERGLLPMMLVTDRLLEAYPHVTVEFAGELVEHSDVGQAFRLWHRHHPHRRRILHRTYDFKKVRNAYREADIAVIPSTYSEGTSYSCLEAMSCGLPVVASNVGGLNDLIIDGFNGLKTTPTPQPLLDALIRLVEDAELRRKLSRHARQTALAFDKRVWDSRWRNVLAEFLGWRA
ncbi:glycosyltransferase family 4 protein [Paenibacillus koleovorans]|uniref:glycosyltransferase family 4 protein n=1 Tax=Paenibacillus koleovorans TaxID=121608 RepID=UPI000FD8D795|nr:glycosyltransferase family 4 protein [Paenibacillus koleovorans]